MTESNATASDVAMAEKANWHVTHSWGDGLDLVYKNVPMPDAMAYDLMRLLGQFWLGHLAKAKEQESSGNPGTTPTA